MIAQDDRVQWSNPIDELALARSRGFLLIRPPACHQLYHLLPGFLRFVWLLLKVFASEILKCYVFLWVFIIIPLPCSLVLFDSFQAAEAS